MHAIRPSTPSGVVPLPTKPSTDPSADTDTSGAKTTAKVVMRRLAGAAAAIGAAGMAAADVAAAGTAAPGTGATDQGSDGAREIAPGADPSTDMTPPPARKEGSFRGPGTPTQQPSTTDQLEQARAHEPPPEALRNLPPEDQQAIREQYAAEQSKLYDEVATRLENGQPRREDFTINGKFLEWEYRDAVAAHADQLEEAQQGAKPARESRMRAELEQTASGREMLEFERRAGVPIKVLTDREWRAAGHDPNTLAFSSGDDGLTFNVRHLNSHVYVHEMTHQVDHRTRILAPEGDARTKDEVVAEATAKYREFGLDPTEVQAVVDATYHQPEMGHSLTHAHTRLAEARHHRLEQGGEPLTQAEMREVMALSLPREQDGFQLSQWNEHKDDPGPFGAGIAELKLRTYAQSRGIEVEGRTGDEIATDLQELADTANDEMVAIEQRGTNSKGIGDLGGMLGGIGSIGGAFKDASLPAGAVPAGG